MENTVESEEEIWIENTEESGEEIENLNWNRNQIKLLLCTRLKYEDKFIAGCKQKSSLWSMVLRDIQSVDKNFPFSKEACKVKFTNLFTTYKRIKKRQSQSGRNTTMWEYFEDFDSVYGNSYHINPPEANLSSSIDYRSDTEETSFSPPPKKTKIDDVLHFLTEEAKEAERRHKELLEIEKERISILKSLQNTLQYALNK